MELPLSPTFVVLFGTALLGLNCGVVGSFAVLRRRALLGDAIAHAALPGICLSYLVVGERHFGLFLLGAFLFGLFAASSIAFIRSYTRIKEDTAIALAIGCYFGLGIVLSRIIQNDPSGNRAGIDSFIVGKAASMVQSDSLSILIVSAISLSVVAIFFKEFKLLAFDRDFMAATQGRVARLEFLLLILITLATVIGLPAVGVVLVVSLFTIPAVTAQLWANRLSSVVLIAGAIGCMSGALGTLFSAYLPVPAGAASRGWPTGPLITLTAASVFVISLLLAPHRGIVSRLVRRVAFERRIARQNLLRAIYEHLELSGDLERVWRPSDLQRFRGQREWRRALGFLVASGFCRRDGEGFVLTGQGRNEAARVVRAHRLWELYLIEQADIAPDHVDRDADELEHHLSPDLLQRLESKLFALGKLPSGELDSPHTIGHA